MHTALWFRIHLYSFWGDQPYTGVSPLKIAQLLTSNEVHALCSPPKHDVISTEAQCVKIYSLRRPHNYSSPWKDADNDYCRLNEPYEGSRFECDYMKLFRRTLKYIAHSMPDLYKAEFSISPAVLEHSEGFFKTHIILCSISFTRNKTFFFFFGNQQKNVAWFHPKKQRKQAFGEKMVDFSCIWPRGLFCARLYGFCVQKTLNRISLVEINSERAKAFCQADSLWAEREHRKPHPQDNSVTPRLLAKRMKTKLCQKGHSVFSVFLFQAVSLFLSKTSSSYDWLYYMFDSFCRTLEAFQNFKKVWWKNIVIFFFSVSQNIGAWRIPFSFSFFPQLVAWKWEVNFWSLCCDKWQ